jgi:hypothetical protein
MVRIGLRPRRAVVALCLVTVICGLASRRFPELLPAFVAHYAGDTLWASMVYWILVLLRPRARVPLLGVAAFSIALGVELSQRYHAAWLDALRSTPVGALLLGQGFLWSDVVCYAAGVALAMVLDALLLRRGDGAHAQTQTG